MKSSEVLTKLFSNEDKDQFLARLMRKKGLRGNCPLNCPDVGVSVVNNRLIYREHRGLHPQSTRCYWSGQEVQDRVGATHIEVHMNRT